MLYGHMLLTSCVQIHLNSLLHVGGPWIFFLYLFEGMKVLNPDLCLLQSLYSDLWLNYMNYKTTSL